jgi:hypothetical protein
VAICFGWNCSLLFHETWPCKLSLYVSRNSDQKYLRSKFSVQDFMYWTRIMHWCPNDSGVNNKKHKPRHEFLVSNTDRVNYTYETWVSVADNCSLNCILYSIC